MATVGATPSGWPPYLDPMAWVRAWGSLVPAPQSLTQPILPGWIFGPVTINEANSSAPRTEWEIVQRHSYGRQLGRIADALQALIERGGGDPPSDSRIDAFLSMKNEIDALKRDAGASRIDALRAELAKLPEAERDELRRLLDQPPR